MEAVETDLLRYIILLPLAGALVNGLFNRSKNVWPAGLIACAASLGSFSVALMAILKFGATGARDSWFTWFEAGAVKVPFHLELSPISAIMLMVVTGIGSLIHIYSLGYMSHDKSPWRFFCYLNLFLSAMLVLILSANLVGVFLGWEGVGLCSYLLIGFWYESSANTAAGMKAFLVNRIGDLGFLIALFAVFAWAGTADVRELVLLATQTESRVPAIVWLVLCGGIFWAATGKSAQIPLYVWLPDAMAGPTPVSALIHAATMVTSGIVVVTRLWPIFATQPEVLDVMLVCGVSTAWLAALIALTQRDIKKVLAYSTVSQLGFMFAALGVGSPTAALFHVVTHACFKALLFLGAGSVIHGMHEKQDLFEMGGLRKFMPLTHITFLIGTMAIIGFPFSAGFFSKDMILAKAFEHSSVVYFLLLGAAVLTAFYMLRAYALAFWGEGRSKEAKHAHESSSLMVVPLVVLAFLSVFAGWIETPDMIGGIHSLDHWVKSSWYGVSVAVDEGHALSHSLELALMAFTLAAALTVAWFSYLKYREFKSAKAMPAALNFFHKISENKFYLDQIYEFAFVKPLGFVSEKLTRFIDTGLLNGAAHGVRDVVKISGQALSLFHTGNLQTYGWYLAVGSALAVLVSWMALS